MSREESEVDAETVPGCAKRIGSALLDARGVQDRRGTLGETPPRIVNVDFHLEQPDQSVCQQTTSEPAESYRQRSFRARDVWASDGSSTRVTNVIFAQALNCQVLRFERRGDMAEYRALVVDSDGVVWKRFEFDVQHDTGAVNYAQRYLERNDVEVWQGSRRVAVLNPTLALSSATVRDFIVERSSSSSRPVRR